jgi:hypothetical protein
VAARLAIRPAVFSDAEAIHYRLRPADRAEVVAASGPDVRGTIFDAIMQSKNPGAAMMKRKIVAVFGVVPVGTLSSGMASPWLLGAPELETIPREFTEAARAYITAARAWYPRLVNFVDDRNTVSKRWLARIGFTLDEPQPFGVERLPFRRFHVGFEDV